MGRRRDGARLGPSSGFPAQRSSWPPALLAASILGSCFLLTQAQDIIPVMLEPPKQIKGQDVTLIPGGTPDFVSCNWYREATAETTQIFTYFPPPNPVQQNFTNFTGRETAGPGCTLHIRNLALNDTGDYIVTKIARTRSERGQEHIDVLEKLSQPILWPAESTVKEHENVTLNCITSESSSVTISWLKDGKSIPMKSILSSWNRTLTVPDIGKDDEGMYTCEARNLANSATSNPSKITLENGASPEIHSSSAAGAIAGIVLGSLAIAALAGTLLYCFFRSRRRKDKNSKQTDPTSPVYENTCPSAWAMPKNSSDINNTYEELQYEKQPEYDQLRW